MTLIVVDPAVWIVTWGIVALICFYLNESVKKKR